MAHIRVLFTPQARQETTVTADAVTLTWNLS